MGALRAAISAELWPLQQQQAERDARLQQQLAALQVGDLTSPSDAERGQTLLKRCPSNEEGITAISLQRALDGDAAKRMAAAAAAAGSGDSTLRDRPILAPDELSRLLAQLDKSYLEAELVALLTPTLLDVVRQLPDPEQLLVNSESLEWLRTASGDKGYFQKPDLFVCHRSAFLAGAAPAGASFPSQRAAQLRSDSPVGAASFLFGRCAWPLREAVECIIEAKRKHMSLNAAVGECFAKAQNLLRGSSRPSRKVVLFDAAHVRLLVFSSSGLLSMQTFGWTAPGSFVVLLDFLHTPASAEPDWLCVLRSACAHFQVTLAPSNAFLGQGATGRVFRVLQRVAHGDAEEEEEEEVKSAAPAAISRTFALKVVEEGPHGEHITSLCREVEELTRLLAIPEGQPVRRYLPSSCTKSHSTYDRDGRSLVGAAAMFEPVGVSLYEAKRTEALWLEVCRAFAALHAAGIWHGDPRLPNIIRVSMSKSRAGAATRLTPSASSAAAAIPSSASVSSTNGQLVWIDLRTSSQAATAFDMRVDCDILLQSFFARVPKDDQRVLALADEYSNLPRGEAAPAAVDALERWSQQAWNILHGTSPDATSA
jgi:hypothetical protein